MSAFKTNAARWFDATMDGAVKVERRKKPGYIGPDMRLQYVSKGTDGFTARRYDGGKRTYDGQGDVLCKRSGASQNLDWKARSEFHDNSAHTRKAGAP